MLEDMAEVNKNTIKKYYFHSFRLVVCLSLIEVDLQIVKNR